MIESKIDTIRYENGEIQRYQRVSGFAWNDLEFAQGTFTRESFEELLRMYRIFIATKNPSFYGALVAFHIPDDIPSPFPSSTEFGLVFDKQAAAAIGLRRMVAEGSIRKCGHSLKIDAPEIRQFIETLEKEGWLGAAFGDKENEVSIMPVGSDLGYLSSIEPTPRIVCNSHFFTMDLFDCDSPYDVFGTPYGMIVKDGIVSQPPLNHREALMVDMDGKVRIARPEVKDNEITLQGKTFRHGRNCTIYQRPETRITPEENGLDVIIAGDEVVAFHEGGSVSVPMNGFVLHTTEELEQVPTPVIYPGYDDCLFGIQVGSSSVKDGIVAGGFESSFYNIYSDPVPYPPTLYPLDYEKARAPRMAICSDSDGDPVIIWAEGPSKLYYQKGIDSCGASLLELGKYCKSIGMVNALNLDGGGSAEIFTEGKLLLHVSDRLPDNSDAERPVPMGLMIRNDYQKLKRRCLT